jgi:hypothetical protein
MALIETVVGVLTTGLLGVVAWAFQLGTRVSVAESKYEDLVILINTKFDEVNRRLGRIERVMNGHLREED